jgi:tRNA pseudouridine55 synthase
MDGILNINKPSGKTSFSMVALVRRLSGERRVGHAGTLDPEASGVLPVCLGQGTRVIEFLLGWSKVYRAEISLGVATDTYDATGKIIRQADPSRISRRQVETALGSFCGLISQMPPMYSALKYRGQRLYELARAGVTVSRESRQVKVYQLKLIDFKLPLVTIEVECGRGTYIRSLAHDLGELLGCGAHLKSLVRSRYGPFDIADAVSPSQLEDAFSYNHWQDMVYPMDTVLSHWAAVVISEQQEWVVRNGGPLVLEDAPDGTGFRGQCRVYSQDGCFLAVLRFNHENGQWQPEKVFV